MKGCKMEPSAAEFLAVVAETMAGSRLASEREYTQHGDTSCLLHSVAVAYHSWRMAHRLGAHKFNIRALIRGALLHDYFLYDWHTNPVPENGLHGYSHPYTAWQNASQDYQLSEIETDIIRKHMFPLTLLHAPKYRESWVVSMVDKACSLYEVFARKCYRVPAVQEAVEMIVNESKNPLE